MVSFSKLALAAGVFAALGAAVLFDSRPGHAVEYPWCMVNNDRDSGMIENCGFVSFNQCLQTLSGMSGMCVQNTRYRPEPQRAPAPRQRSPR